MSCPPPEPPDWTGLGPIHDEDLANDGPAELRQAIAAHAADVGLEPSAERWPPVLSDEALVVDARVLGQEGEPVLLVGLGEPTSPRVVDVESPPASTIISFETAGRWFWQCTCTFFATGLDSREAMLADAAAHVRSGRCPFYCGDCGARLVPGSWPFCASVRNPKGHDRDNNYSIQV